LLVPRFWSPGLETIALGMLDSQDANVVGTALAALQQYGSPEARPVILKHFAAWNVAWKPQAALFHGQAEYPADPLARLDSAYLRALIFGYGWLTSQADIEAIGRLCLSWDCRNEAHQRDISYKSEHDMIVLASDADKGGSFDYGFFPYGHLGDLQRMQNKILQFPRGTCFQFDTRRHSESTAQKVMATLGTWMTAHGYALQLYREPHGD
jgi:hypothetical protein